MFWCGVVLRFDLFVTHHSFNRAVRSVQAVADDAPEDKDRGAAVLVLENDIRREAVCSDQS